MFDSKEMTPWQREVCLVYNVPPWIAGFKSKRDRLWWYSEKIRRPKLWFTDIPEHWRS